MLLATLQQSMYFIGKWRACDSSLGIVFIPDTHFIQYRTASSCLLADPLVAVWKDNTGFIAAIPLGYNHFRASLGRKVNGNFFIRHLRQEIEFVVTFAILGASRIAIRSMNGCNSTNIFDFSDTKWMIRIIIGTAEVESIRHEWSSDQTCADRTSSQCLSQLFLRGNNPSVASGNQSGNKSKEAENPRHGDWITEHVIKCRVSLKQRLIFDANHEEQLEMWSCRRNGKDTMRRWGVVQVVRIVNDWDVTVSWPNHATCAIESENAQSQLTSPSPTYFQSQLTSPSPTYFSFFRVL